jgi:hypothetical protein
MNEISTQLLKEIDAILKDITETRRKVQFDKEPAKIKYRDNYLMFINVDIKVSNLINNINTLNNSEHMNTIIKNLS